MFEAFDTQSSVQELDTIQELHTVQELDTIQELHTVQELHTIKNDLLLRVDDDVRSRGYTGSGLGN